MKYLLKLTLILSTCTIFGQQQPVSSGGEATGAGGKVSYSVSQIAYTYVHGTTSSVSQGVQQAFEISTLGGDEYPLISLEMSLYPNPTTSTVTLKTADFSTEIYRYQLFDIAGKQIFNKQILISETAINMSDLPNAIYFLKVINQNKTIKTFKIIKN